MADIAYLVRKYEAGDDAGCVSTGSGDLGGISYGIYQFSSNAGSVEAFLRFACDYYEPSLANYGRVLSQYEVNSDDFIAKWQEIGSVDSVGFGQLQDDYAENTYYSPASEYLANNYYDMTDKTIAMKAVLMSRAIQYGAGNMVELYLEAVHRIGYDNLSYVNDAKYDYDMIASIYDFLIEECDNAYETDNGLYHSPNDWCNGSYTVVKIGLRNRFVNEKADALAMLN